MTNLTGASRDYAKAPKDWPGFNNSLCQVNLQHETVKRIHGIPVNIQLHARTAFDHEDKVRTTQTKQNLSFDF
jgi:hypothetical protein